MEARPTTQQETAQRACRLWVLPFSFDLGGEDRGFGAQRETGARAERSETPALQRLTEPRTKRGARSGRGSEASWRKVNQKVIKRVRVQRLKLERDQVGKKEQRRRKHVKHFLDDVFRGQDDVAQKRVEQLRFGAIGALVAVLGSGCNAAETFNQSYGSLCIALGSFTAAVVALLVAERGRRHSASLQRSDHQHQQKLEAQRRAPKIFVRPTRVYIQGVGRTLECNLENHGEQPAEIRRVILRAAGSQEVLYESDTPIYVMPKEWYPGPSVNREKLEESDVEQLECIVKYHQVGEEQLRGFETVFSRDGRTSNPMGDRSIMSIRTRDQFEQAGRDYFRAKLEKEKDA